MCVYKYVHAYMCVCVHTDTLAGVVGTTVNNEKTAALTELVFLCMRPTAKRTNE